MKTFSLPKITSALTPNGLKIYAVPKPELPLVSLHLVLPLGAEADSPGKAGRSDLTAEMLTLGTKKRSAAQLAAEVDALGAILSAHSGWDATILHISGLREDFAKLMDLLLEICTQPAFSPAEFEHLQKRRIAALVQQRDESQLVADERFQEILFQGTAYDHPVYGTLKSLPLLSCEEVAQFYQSLYLKDGCFLVVAGDFPVEDCFRWVEANFPPVNSGKTVREQDFSPLSPSAVRTILIDRPDLTQSQIRLGHVGIHHAHADYLSFEVMNYVLGAGGFSSRLMQRVRSELGYTYGIRASLDPRKKAGPFLISTFTPTETTFPCVREILTVERSFIDQGATDQERAEAINFLTGSYPMKFETLSQIGQRIIQAEVNGLGLEYLSVYPTKVSAMTLEEIGRSARKHLHPERMLIVIVGRAGKFREEFAQLGPVEIRE
ncbi:MAG: pitrilysin family protein [Thermodesulfobacteriota bacterium]|nr:pitrilysin family protein [Thermodesulfobacteriota bacterium]